MSKYLPVPSVDALEHIADCYCCCWCSGVARDLWSLGRWDSLQVHAGGQWTTPFRQQLLCESDCDCGGGGELDGVAAAAADVDGVP